MHSEWCSVPELLSLETNELQVWRVHLEETLAPQSVYMSYLNCEEQDRANRLRAGDVRKQFVVARACLRMLLGTVSGIDPRHVPIVHGAYGKPETPDVDGHRIFFNVAHSNGTIVIALSRNGAVGVDIEAIDERMNVMEVAWHSFTPGECNRLAALISPDQRQRAFFRCWTRKEAVAKADGRGLSLPLSSFEVPIGPAQSAPVQLSRPDGGSVKLYYVSDLDLEAPIAGSFALESSACKVRLLNMPL